MNPVPFSNKTETRLTRETNDPLVTGCSAETKRALQLLSGEMQKYFSLINDLVEKIPTTPERSFRLKSALEEQLTHLNEKLSLMGTILETDSSEILSYVKKSRP